MPWIISKRDGKYCVVKRGESSPVPGGCHASRADAIKHQAALYASEPGMTASAVPVAPPAEWFSAAEPDHPEPLTVDADGRVHGHLALWDACHIGFLNGSLSECVKPPRSRTDYGAFHLGQLATADGGTVPVGKIVYGGSHATITAGLLEARAHYDKTGSVGAFVQARDGKHGIYLTGAARSDLSAEGLRDLRANPPSGDWRRLNDALELVASLAVGVPGYQTPLLSMTASGEEVETLILPGYTEEEVMDEERGVGYVRRKRMIRDELEFDSLTAAATTFTAEERQRLAKAGIAMGDGSFPIRNCQDLMDARRSIGRTPPGRRAAVRAHISKRGSALGCGGE